MARLRPWQWASPTIETLEPRLVRDAAGNQAFVSQAYQDILGRAVDPAGLATFTGALNNNSLTRFQVALALQFSPEHVGDEVNSLFSHLLKRAPDPVGQAAFSAELSAGDTVEQAEAQIIGSAEYYQSRGGGTVDGFITALYTDVLGRNPDPGGQASIENALAKGYSRTLIATYVLQSSEYQQVLVQGLYQEFLRRSVDAGGLASYTAWLSAGVRDEYVIAALVGSDEYYFNLNPPTANISAGPNLTPDEVSALLSRAAAATASDDGIVAIVDRGGNILGVRVEGNVSTAITGNTANMVFAIDGAVSLARTGAFFANDQAPLTSRTIRDLSESTMTQREVDSNPNITDPNSTVKGPGFVAPIGVGGHFPANVSFTPPVDLYDIEFTNRDSSTTSTNRFNVPTAYLPSNIPAANQLHAPDSYGVVSGLMPNAQSRGIATLPGGIPIYINGTLVGGIGVFFPGTTGYASAENSVLSTNHDPTKPDRSLEAEYDAFAALGGSAAAGYSIGTLGGVAPVAGVGLPFGRIDLAGITLDVYGPGGDQGPQNLVTYGQTLGQGDANSGSNQPIAPTQNSVPDVLLKAGQTVPDGWLVLPHAGGNLSAADVEQMIEQGITQANATRAAIRLPLGSTASMVFAVSDTQGNILGLYRMPDATIFSLDVAVAKARNVAYYDDPALLQPQDQVAGVAPGVAFTNRTFRFLAQPRFPEGIDGTPPAPYSILNDGGSNPITGLDVGAPLPASAFQSVEGYAAFNPGTNFRSPTSLANQNGIVFFPGSSPLYKTVNGVPQIVGGLGVSGDGVNQDDLVTIAAAAGYATPASVPRADQVFVRGVRLPYQDIGRNPEE